MVLRHPLFPAALALAGILASTLPGIAQTVSDSCTLVQPANPGQLVAIGSPLPTKLVSTSVDGGTPAQLAINCTQSATLQVSVPVQTIGPSFTPTSSRATVTASTGGQANSSTGQSLVIPPNANGTMAVDIVVDRGSNMLLAGTYGYNVIVTITP